MSETLRAEDLTLGYGADPIVRDVWLRVAPGRLTAIIGPNGGGKSTLLTGLAGALRPVSGDVYLGEAALRRIPPRKAALRIAHLPQRPLAPEGLTVRELVAQGRYPHRGWLAPWSARDQAATDTALARAGATELAERRVDALSGGQQQRAWIAMALAQETEILLLDEPTASLDLAHQLDTLGLLRALCDDAGATIVVVLHDLSQAARWADEIVALRGGRILAQGSPADVVTPETIAAVFDVEALVVEDPVTGGPLCAPVGRVNNS